jgi:hypothetical protein
MTLLIIIRYHEQAAALAAQQARLALEDTGPDLATHYATAGELRGIPAIGRSVAGVIPYTDPYRETARREAEAQRLRERTAA